MPDLPDVLGPCCCDIPEQNLSDNKESVHLPCDSVVYLTTLSVAQAT
jgi:hypothetical protein